MNQKNIIYTILGLMAGYSIGMIQVGSAGIDATTKLKQEQQELLQSIGIEQTITYTPTDTVVSTYLALPEGKTVPFPLEAFSEFENIPTTHQHNFLTKQINKISEKDPYFQYKGEGYWANLEHNIETNYHHSSQESIPITTSTLSYRLRK
jgi:hypothetical protein